MTSSLMLHPRRRRIRDCPSTSNRLCETLGHSSFMNAGILLVAHGRRAYWDEAVTLAKSLRLRSPGVHLAIASDLGVSESRWRAAGFDAYVPFDFRSYGGVSFKMQLDRITPYEDATLFLDSDSICYRDISGVFEAFASSDFVTLGMPVTGCHWFENNSLIHREFHCDLFPFFCGDFYLFRKSPTVAAVFDTAREIAGRYRSLGIKPLGGWCNDEPAFSLAMLTHGVPAQAGVGDWILQTVHSEVADIDLDYTVGKARAVIDSTPVRPRLIHFSADRSQPIYFRERYRVRYPTPAAWNQIIAHGVGSLGSARYRLWRRLQS
jgi:hypothetical protein